MPETLNGNLVFSLKEVAESIKRTLQNRYKSSYWVKAEMNRLNHYQYSGHCYPDLIQKTEGVVIAQMRSVLWSGDCQRINHNFIQTTGEPLREGIQMLFKASIQFDANHGLSLQIHDIDPVFTLGELEREKRETIRRLKAEGLFQQNTEKKLPILIKRLAVISVSTSKGLADFEQVLRDRVDGFRIDMMLFPSLLQGEKAASQIERQLERIASVAHYFDAVAIIRGGGSEVGLTAFNDFRLASAICRFPLPVLTGIGHATNLTVAEMVAHTHAITPTKLAEIIIQRFVNVKSNLKLAAASIFRSLQRLRHETHRLESLTISLKGMAVSEITIEQNRLHDKVLEMRFLTRQQFRREIVHFGHLQQAAAGAFQEELIRGGNKIDEIKKSVHGQLQVYFAARSESVNQIERLVELSRPEKILKRGFSIVYHNGRALTNVVHLNQDAILDIRLAQGRVVATATEIHDTLIE